MAKVTWQENRMEGEIAGKNFQGIFVNILTLQMFLCRRKLLPIASTVFKNNNTFHLHSKWVKIKWSAASNLYPIYGSDLKIYDYLPFQG